MLIATLTTATALIAALFHWHHVRCKNQARHTAISRLEKAKDYSLIHTAQELADFAREATALKEWELAQVLWELASIAAEGEDRPLLVDDYWAESLLCSAMEV